MPAYTTIEFGFLKKNLSARFVQDLYSAFHCHGIEFDKVFAWGCSENLQLPDIIAWNQSKLDANFKLGYNEDVSNNYRQIL